MFPSIGVDAPDALRAVLKSLHDSLSTLLTPGAPTPLFAAPQAGLPPAAQYPGGLALVTDLNILVHSDGIHWIRQDTGGVVV